MRTETTTTKATPATVDMFRRRSRYFSAVHGFHIPNYAVAEMAIREYYKRYADDAEKFESAAAELRKELGL